MGQDEDSLTEQESKRKITTIILIKRIHKARDTECNVLTAQCPSRSWAVIPLPWPAPPAISWAPCYVRWH